MRLITAVKNPTEELTSIYFITLVVGYFANAQYDVLFFIRHSERSEESHRRTDEAYTLHFGRGIFRLRSNDGNISTNPCYAAKNTKEIKKLCVIVTLSELNTLQETAKSTAE